MSRNRKFQSGILAVLVVLLVGVSFQRQAVADWIRLRGYEPSQAVSSLADQDTMTIKAKHLFYVNRPQVSSGGSFRDHCPSGQEKTVVLGCYVGNDQGIYIYDVTDERLDGVEQVTAAHEMLHAAYRRLSDDERKRIDGLLLDFYQHKLADQRVRATIDSYKKTEPNDVVNEMHSIFATEMPVLPAELETYYRQYFTSRSTVAAFTARYQGEFTSRQYQIKAYETQLALIKQQVDVGQASLKQQAASLEAEEARLNGLRASGKLDEYNASVANFNAAVETYKDLFTKTKAQIAQYNETVTKRNALALEERQLSQALSADNLQER